MVGTLQSCAISCVITNKVLFHSAFPLHISRFHYQRVIASGICHLAVHEEGSSQEGSDQGSHCHNGHPARKHNARVCALHGIQLLVGKERRRGGKRGGGFRAGRKKEKKECEEAIRNADNPSKRNTRDGVRDADKPSKRRATDPERNAGNRSKRSAREHSAGSRQSCTAQSALQC